MIELNKQGYKSIEISKILNIHPTTVCKNFKKWGIVANNHLKLTSDDKEDIKKQYLSGKTIQEIHKLYKDKVSEGAINWFLKKEKITRPNGKKAVLDHNFFETIDTEEKAYFLGFIMADGSIQKVKKSKNGFSYVISIEIKVSDKYILEKFKNAIRSNLEVKEFKSERSQDGWKPKHNAYFRVFSQKMFMDLNKLEVHPNKTFVADKLPKLSKEMMRHYIRGFFDGDGTVYVSKSYREPRPIFGFYGTYSFITNFRDFLEQEINLKHRKVHEKKTQNVSMVTYSTIDDIINFYDYIYRDSTIYLHRKKDIFDKYIVRLKELK